MNYLLTHTIRFSKIVVALLLGVMVFLRAVFPAMDNEEAKEVRRLVEHFHEHNTSNHHSTWWAFLLEHYSPASAHTASSTHSAKHHGLPLHCSHPHGASFVALPILDRAMSLQFPTKNYCPHFSCTNILPILYTSIFQPPKISSQVSLS